MSRLESAYTGGTGGSNPPHPLPSVALADRRKFKVNLKVFILKVLARITTRPALKAVSAMIVFISWSGELSGAFAELLRNWLPDVIQRVKPWISSQDIDKGSLWSSELNDALATTVGVLCVTQENKDAPWLLFEAGALSKGLTKSRVCPLLIDLRREDVRPPLSLFNLTLPDEADMWKLVKSIDAADPENKLPEERLKRAFDQRWPDFDRESKAAREKHRTRAPVRERTEKELMVEVLDIVRKLQRDNAESKERLPFSSLVVNPAFSSPPSAVPKKALSLYLDQLDLSKLEVPVPTYDDPIELLLKVGKEQKEQKAAANKGKDEKKS